MRSDVCYNVVSVLARFPPPRTDYLEVAREQEVYQVRGAKIVACVYALSSSLNPDTVRYVGKSKEDNGAARLKQHLKESRKSRTRKCTWVRSVQSAGGVIVSTVLESGLSYAESGIREIFYIAYYRGMGNALTNLTDGGEGSLGAVRSPDTRAKISAGLTGKPKPHRTNAHRAALSTAFSGRTVSAETRAKISAAHTGKIRTAEHRAALSAANMGKTLSSERCAEMSARQMGKTQSSETRAKRSAALVGRPLTAAHRRKIGAANKARAAQKKAEARQQSMLRHPAGKGK